MSASREQARSVVQAVLALLDDPGVPVPAISVAYPLASKVPPGRQSAAMSAIAGAMPLHWEPDTETLAGKERLVLRAEPDPALHVSVSALADEVAPGRRERTVTETERVPVPEIAALLGGEGSEAA